MSGLVKSVKKVFKKVVKTVAKVAPAALAIGAAVFTAGSALGLPAISNIGGWEGAVSQMTEKLGFSGTMANIISSGVTQAGRGALIGAGVAAVTGGDINKGLGTGALAGGALGAAQGYMGSTFAPTGDQAGSPGFAGGSTGSDPSSGLTFNPTGTVSAPATDLSYSTGGGASGVGGLLSKGGWLERNQDLAGSLISGVGEGLLGKAQADDANKAAEQQATRIANNYTVGGGLLNPSTGGAGANAMSPAERFGYVAAAPVQTVAPATTPVPQYVLDPVTGRYTLVQT